MNEGVPRPLDSDDARTQSRTRRLRLASALLAAALLLLFWVIVVAVAGGFTLRAGFLRISSHRVLPVLAALLLAAGTARWVGGPQVGEAWARLRSTVDAWAAAAAALIAVVFTGVSITCSTRIAADSDPYGYVSQAELWMKGRLIRTDPLAFTLARRFRPHLFAPPGYVPGRQRGEIVPLYPPGLPMAMGAAGRLFGPEGIYLVVPACGGLLIGVAFLLGRRMDGSFTGVATAGLVAAHPSTILQSLQPMSDVPAALAWTTALVLACRDGLRPAFAAGLAGSAAILVRPNLAPLTAAVALTILLAERSHGRGRVGVFAVGLIPAAVVLATFNTAMYGSPFLSGYGQVGPYFRMTHIPDNAIRYSRWLLETQGFLVFLALLAPILWRLGSLRTESGEARPPLAGLIAFGAILCGIYGLYLPFDEWPYVRFLLPGLPLALALAAARTLLGGLTAGPRAALLVALVAVSFATSLRFTREHGTLDLRVVEERYVTVGRYIARALPERAAFLCVLHCGAVRYYAGRETLRFDWLDPDRLEALLERLEKRGYRPYVLLEEWEEPIFRERFAGATRYGRLDWPPIARLKEPAVVTIWDPRDRTRHRRGEPIHTDDMR